MRDAFVIVMGVLDTSMEKQGGVLVGAISQRVFSYPSYRYFLYGNVCSTSQNHVICARQSLVCLYFAVFPRVAAFFKLLVVSKCTRVRDL